ncbi:diacylglycerol kinase family lipid kinase [Lentzea tibetensis]|uniref:Diacylglycerol kinase family lipid kinase n=1 Tax=Lentzea tibetensis TaxID=2591470 RepID=A0A563EZN7_9PSEU|nr:diacylglycerol kinase family protein [Lentzea tibetensis]TWP53197.1 diacylglycerol kinase family lipid kinase [Lentzea tibetensis]
MRALLVVNPQATTTTPAGRDVLAHALASDVKLEIVETCYRGHAADAAAQAVEDGFDLVVAHGGDGTVNEVVNGLLREGISPRVPMIGVVPGGSANVFAGALGLPRDPVEATHRLLQAIEHGTSRRISLGQIATDQEQVSGRWFTFNAGIGLDADVVAGVEHKRAKGREASPALYLRTALKSYAKLLRTPAHFTVEIPGEEPFTDLGMVFVSNTDPWTYFGDKAIQLNPSTGFDGGLGLSALRTLRVPTVARYITQVLAHGNPKGGNLVRRDDVSYVRVTCEEPANLQVDGDFLGTTTAVEFRAVPEALTVCV